MTVRVWIDVEDLFEYVRSNSRPSGIQRFAFEVYRALRQRDTDSHRIHFVRHDALRNDFRTVAWTEIAALFENMVSTPPGASIRLQSVKPRGRVTNMLRALVYRLPAEIRVSSLEAVWQQRQALSAWITLCGAVGDAGIRGGASMWRLLARLVPGHRLQASIAPESERLASFAALAAPGDVLLVAGAPWSDPNCPTRISVQRARRGLKVALLVYDVIPIRCPEWCEPGVVRMFRTWLDGMLPLCDHLFAISHHTADELEAYAGQSGIGLRGPVIAVPIGTGFGHPTVATASAASTRLPAPDTYVLCVSTIEARKNHLLLFRLWRRLLQHKPADAVPTLVFAGRIGWLVNDLLQQIANTNNLDGKLVVLENPTDAELTALYRGCRFTVFPSLYEGWGLPVTESLAHGKPCLVANRTSLPEAGSGLVRVFDPDNLNETYDVIRAVIDDPADLADWQAEVRKKFKPVPWTRTADALLTALDHPLSETAEQVANALVP